jgi:hypothetical protein
MRTSHSSYLPHCDLEHRRGRVVEYGIGNLDRGPFVSGEMGLSGGAGTQGQVVCLSSSVSSVQVSGMVRQSRQVER